MIPTPSDLLADDTASTVFFIVAGAFFAGALAWSLLRRKQLGYLPLLLIAGGLIASLQESLIDRMILLWYPQDAPMIAFTWLGMHQPLYMILIYGGFVGVGSYGAYAAIRDGRGGRGLWQMCGAIFLLDALFEIPATASHVYYYYGAQPFQLFDQGWPAWVGVPAATAPLLAGWLLHHIVPRLEGPRLVLVALVPPFAWAAVYFAVGWPTFIAVSSEASELVSWLAATTTFALGFVLVWGLSQAATPDPAPAQPADEADRRVAVLAS